MENLPEDRPQGQLHHVLREMGGPLWYLNVAALLVALGEVWVDLLHREVQPTFTTIEQEMEEEIPRNIQIYQRDNGQNVFMTEFYDEFYGVTIEPDLPVVIVVGYPDPIPMDCVLLV